MKKEYLELSRTRQMGEIEIGRLSYGCWRFSGTSIGEARSKIFAALEIGANLIDTADIYGFGEGGFGDAEQRLGDLFNAEPGLRDKIVLASKGGITPPVPYDSSKAALIKACEASLKRLQVETLDLYYIHRPDNLTSHQEVAEALTTLRQSGKIREAGVSNHTNAQTRALQSKLDFKLVATQPEISPLVIDTLFDGTLDLAQELDMVPMAWSPLAGGRLVTERFAEGEAPEVVEAINRLKLAIDPIAKANNCGHDAVIYAWLLAHPSGIVPIIGSQSPDRIKGSVAAYDVKMTRQDWYVILVASRGVGMP